MKTKKSKTVVVIDDKSYIPEVTAFKVRNKWTPKELLELDTYTNNLDLKSKLQSYIDIDNIEKFTSELINIELPNRKIISICKSKLNIYNKELIIHPLNKNKYIILGQSYRFKPTSKFQQSSKVYSVEQSKDELEPYTSIENDLSFLKDYTFGVELETVGVPLQKSEANALGFHELYDGSIIGPEYTTGIMTYNNFHHLEYFLKLLKTTSLHDHTCSLHIHVGNVKYSDSNLCSIYSLFQRLQEDLNLLIAPYKKDYKFLYNKQKDHCQNLPLIPDLNATAIKDLFKLPHRSDLTEYIARSNKWNLLGRYYTVNFLNYICKQFPNNTIELRSLQMSFNYDYVLTWLIINTAIIDYATKNSKKVLDKREKIQIEDVLSHFITNEKILQKVLNNYHKIKNIIYNKKYLDNDLNTNSMYLDDNLSSIEPIINSSVVTSSSAYVDLIKIKSAKKIVNNYDITDDHIRLKGFAINALGNYSFPSDDDMQLLIKIIKNAMLFAYSPTFKSYEKYVTFGSNVKCNNDNLLFSRIDIEWYCLIENNTLSLVVKQDGLVKIEEIDISELYSSENINSAREALNRFSSYRIPSQPSRIIFNTDGTVTISEDEETSNSMSVDPVNQEEEE